MHNKYHTHKTRSLGTIRMNGSEIHVSSSNTSGERWKIICFSHNADIIINQSFFHWKKKHFKQFKNNYICRVPKHFVHMPRVSGQLTNVPNACGVCCRWDSLVFAPFFFSDLQLYSMFLWSQKSRKPACTTEHIYISFEREKQKCDE